VGLQQPRVVHRTPNPAALLAQYIRLPLEGVAALAQLVVDHLCVGQLLAFGAPDQHSKSLALETRRIAEQVCTQAAPGRGDFDAWNHDQSLCRAQRA
jgi:hypothetical protein